MAGGSSQHIHATLELPHVKQTMLAMCCHPGDSDLGDGKRIRVPLSRPVSRAHRRRRQTGPPRSKSDQKCKCSTARFTCRGQRCSAVIQVFAFVPGPDDMAYMYGKPSRSICCLVVNRDVCGTAASKHMLSMSLSRVAKNLLDPGDPSLFVDPFGRCRGGKGGTEGGRGTEGELGGKLALHTCILDSAFCGGRAGCAGGWGERERRGPELATSWPVTPVAVSLHVPRPAARGGRNPSPPAPPLLSPCAQTAHPRHRRPSTHGTAAAHPVTHTHTPRRFAFASSFLVVHIAHLLVVLKSLSSLSLPLSSATSPPALATHTQHPTASPPRQSIFVPPSQGPHFTHQKPSQSKQPIFVFCPFFFSTHNRLHLNHPYSTLSSSFYRFSTSLHHHTRIWTRPPRPYTVQPSLTRASAGRLPPIHTPPTTTHPPIKPTPNTANSARAVLCLFEEEERKREDKSSHTFGKSN